MMVAKKSLIFYYRRDILFLHSLRHYEDVMRHSNSVKRRINAFYAYFRSKRNDQFQGKNETYDGDCA